MPASIKVRDVFKALGQPTTTYVLREEGKYEKDLSSALDANGTLCLCTGPSKTGKTTLYSRVLSDKSLQPLIARCDASLSANEFWRRALEKIDFSRLSAIQTSKAGKVSGTGKLGGKIGWAWLAGLLGEVSVGVESSMGEVQIREKILSQPSPDHLIPVLKYLPLVLVVEDFHYLTSETKTHIFQQWKAFVDNEVSVIVVGTTHHAVDLAYANKDLVGRIAQIELPTWKEGDLSKIGTQGFNHLSLNVPEDVTAAIASESAGLPIITQEAFCQLLCDKGIVEVQPGITKLGRIKKIDAYRALHNVARCHYQQFEAIYERLVTGPRKLARKYNTYELVLATFTQDPHSFSLKRHEIEERIQQVALPNKELPPHGSVNSMLKALAKFQKSLDINLLEWNESQQRLYILEPSFLFYLRWREPRDTPPSLPEFMGTLIGFGGIMGGISAFPLRGAMFTALEDKAKIDESRNVARLLSDEKDNETDEKDTNRILEFLGKQTERVTSRMIADNLGLEKRRVVHILLKLIPDKVRRETDEAATRFYRIAEAKDIPANAD